MYLRTMICLVASTMVFSAQPLLMGKGVSPTRELVKNPKPSTELLEVEKNIVEYTNQQRRRYGLRNLKIDFKLVESARKHAQWMTQNHSLQHTSATVAENIAMGHPNSRDVVNGWMNSAGHRANILNSSYTRIGVAAYMTNGGTIYWCQQFLR